MPVLKAAASYTSPVSVFFQRLDVAFNNKVKVTLLPVINIPLRTFAFSFSCLFPNLGPVHARIQNMPATAMYKCGCTLKIPACFPDQY